MFQSVFWMTFSPNIKIVPVPDDVSGPQGLSWSRYLMDTCGNPDGFGILLKTLALSRYQIETCGASDRVVI